ncbi:MAG: AMP-binding protein, partial [Myxococcota bacterium]|nr:AMP-binding protein [Myxococcota bacterium]
MIHGNWLQRWSLYAPQKTALFELESGRGVSYRELARRADRSATLLRDRYGVRTGQRVAVLGGNRIE